MLETLTLAELCPPNSTLVLGPDDPVSLAVSAMGERHLSAVVITTGERAVGIFTERDALMLIARGDYRPWTPLGELMSPATVTATAETNWADGYARMAAHGLRHLILVDGQGRLHGVLSESDFARALVNGGERTMAGCQRPLRNILDNLFAYVALLDPQGLVVEVNQAPLTDGGYRREDIIGQHFTETPWWNHDDQVKGQLAAAIVKASQGEPSRYDVAVDMGGTLVPIDLQISPVFDERGTLEGLLATAIDITERKRAESALNQKDEVLYKTEQQIRALIDLLPVGVAAADPVHGGIAFGNALFARMLGYSQEQLRTLTPADLHPPAEVERVMAEFGKAARGEIQTSSEIPIRRRDGSTFLAEIRNTFIELDGRRYHLGLFTDITERKQAEAALRQSEEKFRSLVENTSDCICEVDPEGRFTYLSPQFRNLLGYAPADFIGRSPRDLIPEQEAAQVDAGFKAIVAARQPFSGVQHHNICKDGRVITVEIGGIPIFDPAGEYRGMRGITRDITPRIQAEQQRRESEERYRMLFNNMADAIFIIDLEGNFLSVNAQACRQYGYTREAFQKLHLSEIDTAEDAVNIPRRMAMLEREGTATFEAMNQDSSGRILPVEIHVTRILFDGRPAILGIARDITKRKEDEAALRESHHRLVTVLSAMDSIIYIADMSTYEIRFLNPPALQVFGAVEGQPCYRALQGLDAPCPFCTNDRLLNAEGQPAGVYQWEFQNRLDRRWYELRDCALRWTDGRLARMEIATDMTVRKHTEEVLRESEERFRKLFEDSHLATVLQEGDRCVEANQAALKLLGLERTDQLVGRSIGDLSPIVQPDGQSSAGKARDLIRLALERGAHEFEWELMRADGERLLTQVMMTAIHQGGKDLLHVIALDITEQHRARQQIEFLAFHDPLTGLPNRISSQERLAYEVATARRHHTSLAVQNLDLDKFKYINDTHGQTVGDHLLKGIAQRLREYLGTTDLLCRLSGDEFLIVLPDVPPEHPVSQVADTCERVLASIVAPFDLDGRQLFTTASIGVALYPQDADNGETLVLNAHIALNEAKKAGHNSYRLFEAQMNDELVRFVQTREALRTAVERQELVLHYQPQVDLRSGRVVAVEALLRWHRPGAGLTMPQTFIDVAEESGLITPIGRWVLREACRQAVAWHAAGWPDLVMAVNLSAVQFRQGQVAQDVLAALNDSGLDPTHLELELTESILLEPEDTILETVSRWASCGIRLSIDDFGTGYSSLAYLKRFKVDKLKIDRSFIVNLQRDEEDRAIVLAMIQIARSLNLRTIAEGVEDVELAAQLKGMECDEVQGYLYTPPLPAAELTSWLAEREQRTALPGGIS